MRGGRGQLWIPATLAGIALLTVACAPPPPSDPPDGSTLTVMSFNIHHGVGADNVLDLNRIAATIAGSGAEVVGLQEVDRHFSERSSFVDQATYLATALGMHVAFGANLDLDPLLPLQPRRQYGNAILSTSPILAWSNTLLPRLPAGEQRGLLQVVLDIDGTPVHAYSTHLQHNSADERLLQVNAIIAAIGEPEASVVLLGDLNAEPNSVEVGAIVTELTDAWVEAGVGDGHTFSSINPTRRIDYVLTSPDITARTAAVVASFSSDHLPVVATLALPGTVVSTL